MTFGIVPTGFNAKPLETTLAEIEAEERANIDPLIGTDAEDPVGELNAIMASKITELWQLAGAVYAARDPANATFAQLDSLAAITGTTRAAPKKGTVPLTLGILPGYTVPAGSVAGVSGQPDNLWVTLADATVGIGGPPLTPVNVEVSAIAQTAGVILAPAGTITSIMTPTSGWASVTNPNDATPGTALETDPQFRQRREEDLTAQGGSQIDAIREGLLALTWTNGLKVFAACIVDENASSFADMYGRPPHTIECVLQASTWVDAEDTATKLAIMQLIGLAMWRMKPGGIEYYGTTTEPFVIVDSQGVTRTIPFSGATTVSMWATIDVSIDAAAYPGDDAVKAAIVAYGSALLLGQDVIRSKVLCVVDDVPGVTDSHPETFLIGIGSAVQRMQNVSIDRRALAVFDTARITVNHV